MSKPWNGSIKSTTTDGINVITNESGLAYRRPTYKWDVPYKEWRDEAACSGQDMDLWVLQDPDEVTQEDQEELISWGLAVCAACPERQACMDDSNGLDRYWSTRGGQPPEGLFPDGVEPDFKSVVGRAGGVSPNKGRKLKVKATCKRGHNNWKVRKDGSRACLDCIEIRNKARSAS